MKPRASFVIPAYNADPWISECIKSCIDQDFKRIEIIPVNDGSTDGTKEILDYYAKKDGRVKPVHLSVNMGRSEARNAGNAAAQSPIIMVLDSDDRAIRDRAKITVDMFAKFNPDLLYGSFITIDSFGNMMKRYDCQEFDAARSKSHNTHYIVHSTLAYRKGVTLNIKYESGDVSALGIDDWKFIWEAHLKGYKFMAVKKPLSYYRVLEGSISRTRDEKAVNALKEKILASLQA